MVGRAAPVTATHMNILVTCCHVALEFSTVSTTSHVGMYAESMRTMNAPHQHNFPTRLSYCVWSLWEAIFDDSRAWYTVKDVTLLFSILK